MIVIKLVIQVVRIVYQVVRIVYQLAPQVVNQLIVQQRALFGVSNNKIKIHVCLLNKPTRVRKHVSF